MGNRLKGIIKVDNSIEKTMNSLIQNDIRESSINFNYDELENLETNEKNQLIDCEKSLLFQGKQLGSVSFEIGKALHKAKEILKKSQGDSFMKWYEALGLNKDQVSIFMNKYQLAIDYPSSKELILGSSDVAIKEVMNKNTSPEIVDKFLKGEISTGQQIKNARKNVSRALEIENVQEAELVENSEKIEFSEAMELINKLENKLNKIKKNINKDKGIEVKSYQKLERILEILREV